MNIFYLHKSPYVCATMHNDVHVTKMILETAQLLSTAHFIIDGEKVGYKATHKNHPSAIWCRDNYDNYVWLHNLLVALCREFRYRRDEAKTHATELTGIVNTLYDAPKGIDKDTAFFEPPQCFGKYKSICTVEGDAVEGYRNYYFSAKQEDARGRRIDVWTKRGAPQWWIDRKQKEAA